MVSATRHTEPVASSTALTANIASATPSFLVGTTIATAASPTSSSLSSLSFYSFSSYPLPYTFSTVQSPFLRSLSRCRWHHYWIRPSSPPSTLSNIFFHPKTLLNFCPQTHLYRSLLLTPPLPALSPPLFLPSMAVPMVTSHCRCLYLLSHSLLALLLFLIQLTLSLSPIFLSPPLVEPSLWGPVPLLSAPTRWLILLSHSLLFLLVNTLPTTTLISLLILPQTHLYKFHLLFLLPFQTAPNSPYYSL